MLTRISVWGAISILLLLLILIFLIISLLLLVFGCVNLHDYCMLESHGEPTQDSDIEQEQDRRVVMVS